MKAVLKLNYVGTDFWSRPVYKDQHGKLWKDVELGKYEHPSLCSSTNNEFEGEPDYPIKADFIILEPYKESPQKFDYMMLSKLQVDCDTHLNTANAYRRRISDDDKQYVIDEMKDLWNGLLEKPEWLTWDQILAYEKRILG